MKFRLQSRRLSFALIACTLLSGGLLLSACNTVAGAGQDVSNIGYDVSGGAHAVQQNTNAP